MKNLIKKIIVIVVMSTALLVNANEISTLRNLEDQKTTMLTLLNVKKGNQLLLKDAFGKILYRESIKNSGEFIKGFDLTSLPNGKYHFVLKGELQNKFIPFKINDQRLEYNEDKEFVIKAALTQSKKKQRNPYKFKAIKEKTGSETRVLNFKGSYFNEYLNSTK